MTEEEEEEKKVFLVQLIDIDDDYKNDCDFHNVPTIHTTMEDVLNNIKRFVVWWGRELYVFEEDPNFEASGKLWEELNSLRTIKEV